MPTSEPPGGLVNPNRTLTPVPEQPYTVDGKRGDAAVGEDELGGAAQREVQVLNHVGRERERPGEPGVYDRLHFFLATAPAQQTQGNEGLTTVRGD